MKKKITISLAIIIGASWIFNISYYYMSRLKAPIFIENFKEINVEKILPIDEKLNDTKDDSEFDGLSKEQKIEKLTDIWFDDFTLFYLTNRDDKERIQEIKLPEMDDISMYVYPEVIKSYNNYNLMAINISPRTGSAINFKDEVEQGMNKITKMICYTDSGKKYEVKLGEIYFSETVVDGKDNPICKWNGVSSSSDGTGSNSYSIVRDFYLTSIKSNIFSEIDKVFEISVNGTEIDKMKFPHKFDKENGLDITYRMKSNYYKSLQGNINLKAEYGEIKQEIPMRLQMNSFVQTIQLDKQFIKAIKESEGQAHEIGVK